MKEARRDFLKKSGLLGLATLGKSLFGNIDPMALYTLENSLQEKTFFVLPELPYTFDALEPFIDKDTMMIHHGKHHKAYVDNLNKALTNYSGSKNLPDLLRIASTLNPAIRNNAGGHYNHTLFWSLMKAPSNTEVNEAEGDLLLALKNTFQSTEQFRKEFSEQALKVFGSGWCWLVLNAEKQLKICVSPNQDNPLMDVLPIKGKPILALDVWEHAYYLKYQNKRTDYIQNWWKLVNWQKANQLYLEAIKDKE
jgi:Fe-Mn family superoxide dismutase